MESRGTRRHARGLAALAALVIFGSLACTRSVPAPAPARTFLIGLHQGVSPDAVADERARRGSPVRWRMRSAWRGFVASMSDDEARELARDTRVRFVEPDLEVSAQAQTTPTGLRRIGALANSSLRVNAVPDGDVDADVAVVDSGVERGHRDLNVVTGVDCLSGSCVAGGEDDYGHGTHVAGVVAARDDGQGIVGVAPGARIVPVKVLRYDGNGTVSGLVAGLDWVAANSSWIEVVNISIAGRGASQALHEAVSNLVERGVIVVVAAGNALPGASPADAQDFVPANHPDAITVSAIADYDGLPGGRGSPSGCSNPRGADDRLATFSNYGTVVDLAAPGVCIASAARGGGISMMNGTSMAAPHVAGAAAVLASRSKPADRTGVAGVAQSLVAAGSRSWVDTSGDGVQEPLLDASRSHVLDPTWHVTQL